VWDPGKATILRSIAAQSDGIAGIVWSPDGSRLATGSSDGSVKIFDSETGVEVLSFRDHISAVYAIDWSPDGKKLASGGFDNKLRIWDGSRGYKLEERVYSLPKILLARGAPRARDDDEVDDLERIALNGRIPLLSEEAVLAESLLEQAAEFQGKGEPAHAEPLIRKAIALREVAIGKEAPLTLDAVVRLGSNLRIQGALTEAAVLLEYAVEARSRIFGPQAPASIEARRDLAHVLELQKRYEEAEIQRVEVLECWRRVLGDRDRKTMDALHALGCLYLKQQRFDEAEKVLRTVKEVRKKELGERARPTVVSMEKLADALRSLKRFDEELFLRKMIHAATLDAFGQTDSVAMNAAQCLAVVHRRLGNLEEAEVLLEDVFTERVRTPGRDHPSTMSTLRELLLVGFEGERFTDAASLWRAALADLDNEAFDSKKELFTVLSNASQRLIWAKRYAESVEILRPLVAARARLAPNHSSTWSDTSRLGHALAGLGELEEAEALLTASVARLEEIEARGGEVSAAAIRNANSRLGRLHPQQTEGGTRAEWNRAEGVPIDLTPFFNRDLIADSGDLENDALDDKGGVLIAEGFDGEATGRPDAQGLPVTGRIEGHQLGAFSGPNALALIENGEPVRIEVPPGQYRALALLVCAALGDVQMPIALHYTEGMPGSATVPADDWFDDAADLRPDRNIQAHSWPLIDGMDRLRQNAFHDCDDAALFEVILPVNSGKELVAVVLNPGKAVFLRNPSTPKNPDPMTPRFYLFSAIGIRAIPAEE
jgi:tetratricopeptide (TPR) repeat protein